ncbi:putative proline-specific permease put4 [Pichia kudriavzevii]|uniref:Putative proline-specific permease put4 n=1 Tax=Pichia kudriavzevii TaxID=4909 RepID=A0A1V2LPZ2_PICKU|nr:putative proline-specific permease put4 [Pichia kudriavzevii]
MFPINNQIIMSVQSSQSNDSSPTSNDNKNNLYTIEVEEIDPEQAETTTSEGYQMHVFLNSRHVQIIALAGAISTGLFVASEGTLAAAGPAPLLTGYLILLFLVWFVMNQLADMVTFIPLPGQTTIFALTSRYTGNSSLAFAIGMNIY